MKLDDSVIAHIAQLIQIAIITGTDIVDNMRMITLVESNGSLTLDPDYESQNQENLERMLSQIEMPPEMPAEES